jgi:hypothetical protein
MGDFELELTIRDRCGFADSRGPAAALPCVRARCHWGAKLVRKSIQYGQADRRLLRTAAAAGVPSHTTFSQSTVPTSLSQGSQVATC